MTKQAFGNLLIGDMVRASWWYGRPGGVGGMINRVGDDPVWGRWIWILVPGLGDLILFTSLDADDLEQVV